MTQIAKFMGPTWGPPGSCRPQRGFMLDPWTLLSGGYLASIGTTASAAMAAIYPVFCGVSTKWGQSMDIGMAPSDVYIICVYMVPGCCFSNVSRALQNNFAKIYNASNHIYGDNFKLKLCTCAQSVTSGTRTKFQLEMLIGSAISATRKFRENILESSRNVSETTPGVLQLTYKRSGGTVTDVLAQLSSKVNMLRHLFSFIWNKYWPQNVFGFQYFIRENG